MNFISGFNSFPVQNPPSTSNQIKELDKPFLNISSVNLEEIDVFTQQDYNSLIRDHFSKGVYYLITIYVDEQNHIGICDGVSFIKNYYIHQNSINPLNRQKITNWSIYWIKNPHQPRFEQLFTQNNFLQHRDACLDIVTANDIFTNDLKSQLFFAKSLQNQYEAFSWYKKVADTNCNENFKDRRSVLEASIKVAYAYQVGKGVQLSLQNSVEYWFKASALCDAGYDGNRDYNGQVYRVIAAIYAEGVAVDKNLSKAREYLDKASILHQ